MTDDERRARLLRMLADFDQKIEEVDQSMVDVTLTPDAFARGVAIIDNLKRKLARVEAQLKRLEKK